MSSSSFRVVCVAALGSLSTWLCACTGELTEIMVVVDTDLTVPAELNHVTIDVEGLGDQESVETTLTGSQTLPLSLGLVNEGDRLGPITVRVTGRRGGSDAPVVVVAERSDVHFKKGKTLMLRVDLLRECLSDADACVRSCADGACLTAWTGPPDKLPGSDGGYDAGDDAGSDAADDDGGDDDAGVDDAGVDASGDASDATIDAGPIDPCEGTGLTCFNYAPSNFDPLGLRELAASNGALTVNCMGMVLDSTSLGFTSPCGSVPQVMELDPSDPTAAVVVPLTSLTIASNGALRLVGSRPVIFAVFGNATVDGTLNASAVGGVPGAGGNVACVAGAGRDGANSPGSDAGGNGGGGGGFGSAGGAGGRGDTASSGTAAGVAEGDATLVPLRGGCPGGHGGQGSATDAGNVGGAGGGAVQISAAGVLRVGGVVVAGGGGGQKALQLEDGGGGGGSGGALLLEGERVEMTAGAWASANGGGGGGGSDHDGVGNAFAGVDAPAADALGGPGGPAEYRGGDGGNGAGATTAATAGANASRGLFDLSFGGGGGGGGGGVGRIRVRDNTLGSGACTLSSGNFSPLPLIECGG